MEDNKLKQAREVINKVDKEMASLFVERMQACKMVAEYKKEHGLEIFDPVREEQVICKNSEYVEDEKIRGYYVNFIKNNMQVSRSYQFELMQGMRVAYSGTEGAFAHIASTKLFPTAQKISYGDFEKAYKAVEDGLCDVAVLPIENSYNGEVGQVTDLMFNGSLYVNAVTDISITHNLLGTADADLSSIKTVVSHSQALGQCAEYIKQRGYNTQEYVNTALAAKYVAKKGDKTVAAIASVECAELFGLKVLEKNVNASATNTTRFVVLSRSQRNISVLDTGVHSILLFTVRNQAGALAKAIEIIGKHGFNMRALRSRPMKKLLWQYYFYVECEGNLNGDEGKSMMKELSNYCDKLKIVGTFIKNDWLGGLMTELKINLNEKSYSVFVGKNLLVNAGEYFNLNRKTLVVTDEGVPSEYAQTICDNCKEYKKVVIPSGEKSKSFETLQFILNEMCSFNMDRKDCAVAVGGGVVGDLVGFASSIYMRGIDFYNVPTTLLSQVDSSIGGKTAINFNGIKNVVGSFYQPKAVLIDTEVLKTLSNRLLSNGLVESIKMALTCDKSFFELFENLTFEQIKENLEQIIIKSLNIKKHIVEKDEKESNLRRVLNFGHTFGHGVETLTEKYGALHGECVALGTLPMCSSGVREKLVSIYKKINVSTMLNCNVIDALKPVILDKKVEGDIINAIYVENVGDFEIKRFSFDEFSSIIKQVF